MHHLLRTAGFAFAISGALLLPGSALAHSGLARAIPAAGSAVNPAPKEVVLVFAEKLEPAFSSIEVHDAKGTPMQAGKAIFDDAQPTRMRISLKPLPPGTYKVIWRVLSVDTHRTQGTFTFHVGK
jgi:copper resistance protein C